MTREDSERDYLDETYDELCKECRENDDFPQCALTCYPFRRAACAKSGKEWL